jgi:cellulose synthase/poly-beta-1,6-N-acetylglucosamine synthase-like glycosyltransferase
VYHRRVLAWLVGVIQIATWALLIAASAHLLRSSVWALGRKLDAPRPFAGEEPVVTVQLPVRNERFVVETLLAHVAALEWPRDKLEIQVLDDSDDETSALLDSLVEKLRAGGHDAKLLRRGTRAGFKAGNLQNGLEQARGEWLLVLDADSRPPPEILRQLAGPLAADPKLAFTQARWSWQNESTSLLTRVQALILDGLFLVEQARLSALGKPVSLNGTSCLLKRAELIAAGGWIAGAGSVTEDLDVAHRLGARGLRGVTLPELAVATELPETMRAFRAQQMRWVRGGAETLRARGLSVMGAHLVRHARQPLLLILPLWLAPVLIGKLAAAPSLAHVWPAVLALTWLAIGKYYAVARLRIGRSPFVAFALAPFIMALSIGLAWPLTRALVAGLFVRKGEFVRTPKGGERAPGNRSALVEIAIGTAWLAVTVPLASSGHWLAAAAALFFVSGGLLWVGLESL